MKQRYIQSLGYLALLLLPLGCGREDQPKEGSAEITKTAPTAEMPREQAEQNMRDIGLDPNNPGVRGNRRH